MSFALAQHSVQLKLKYMLDQLCLQSLVAKEAVPLAYSKKGLPLHVSTLAGFQEHNNTLLKFALVTIHMSQARHINIAGKNG